MTVEVKKVEDLGAYVTLLEFGEIEGMVPLSELSRRRIRCAAVDNGVVCIAVCCVVIISVIAIIITRHRSVGKLVRVGRVEIVSVIRVDDKAGYIDLRCVVWGLGVWAWGLGFSIQVARFTACSHRRQQEARVVGGEDAAERPLREGKVGAQHHIQRGRAHRRPRRDSVSGCLASPGVFL